MEQIKIFVDTNIIIVGHFFSGSEVLLFNLPFVDILTADVCLEESRKVTRRLFKENTERYLEALENSFLGFNIIKEKEYGTHIPQASLLILKKKNDQKVLAASLFAKPDFFLSRGDFDKKNIRGILNLKTAEEVLREIGVI